MTIIVTEADQKHRLYDLREHVACEVTIQAARVSRGRERRRHLVDHNGTGNEGAVGRKILKVRFQ